MFLFCCLSSDRIIFKIITHKFLNENNIQYAIMYLINQKYYECKTFTIRQHAVKKTLSCIYRGQKEVTQPIICYG